jgi:choline-phosphate cytidylyltransferase
VSLRATADRVTADQDSRHLVAVAETTRIITFGTFDVFHAGHLRLLERAAGLGSHLVVGISSDELNMRKKGRAPIYPLADRMAIVQGLQCVDEVFVEHSLENKRDYVAAHRASVLVMGDDWAGRFDNLDGLCRVVYLPRTPSVSTTAIIEQIRVAPEPNGCD